MSLLSRFLDRFDAPRHCPDCGQSIEVRRAPTFDPQTGTEVGKWVWSCPDTSLTVTHRGIIRAEQWDDAVHPYGEGEPRWHRLSGDQQAAEDRERP